MCSVLQELVLGPPSQNLCNSPIRMQEETADQVFRLGYPDLCVSTKDNVTDARQLGSGERTQTLSISSQSYMKQKNTGHI